MIVLFSFFNSSNFSFFSLLFVDKKPQKINSLVLNPDAIKAFKIVTEHKKDAKLEFNRNLLRSKIIYEKIKY